MCSSDLLAATRAQLLKFPLFYHSRSVAVVDTPRLADGVWRLPAEAGRTFAVVFRTAPSSEGPVEIRGTFVDVGRFAPDDSRVTAFLQSDGVQLQRTQFSRTIDGLSDDDRRSVCIEFGLLIVSDFSSHHEQQENQRSHRADEYCEEGKQ